MKKALPVVLLAMLAGAAAASASVPASGTLAPRAISEGLPSPPLQPPETARDLDSLLGGLDFFSLIANPKTTNGFTLSGRPALRDDSYENRLKKATKSDGTVVENLYDAQGRKVRESVTISGTTTTRDYVLSGDQVIEQYAGAALSARYVHGRGIDETVRAELDTNADGSLETTVYPLQDELGNVERLTDAAGATVERFDYQGYGKFRIFDPAGASRSVSSYGWKWLFQGREYQSSLAAYDFRARTLWPELGRFGQEDPAGDEDSPNRYQGLLGNWPRFGDPTGLCSDPGGRPGSIRVCIDTFIMTFLVPRVGGHLFLARGDNRDFEAEGTGTYKSRVQFVVDPRAPRGQRLLRTEAVYGISKVFLGAGRRKGFGFRDMEPYTFLETSDETIVLAGLGAFNGFANFPFGPPDDISYSLEFSFLKGGEVELTGTHDGYPSYEIWLYRDDRPAELFYHFREKDIRLLASPEDITVPQRRSR